MYINLVIYKPRGLQSNYFIIRDCETVPLPSEVLEYRRLGFK